MRTEILVMELPDGTLALAATYNMSQMFTIFTASPPISASSALINWLALRAHIILGAQKYLRDDYNGNDRHGIFHGARGQRRANWAYRVGRLINDFDSALIVALVIFGPPTSHNFFDWEIGRSSALASCIADLSITGDQEYSTFGPPVQTLRSVVFSPASLQSVADMCGDIRTLVSGAYATKVYFDKTKGCRTLLQAALTAMPREQANHIKDTVLHLKNIFENTSCMNQTDDQIIQRLTPGYNNFSLVSLPGPTVIPTNHSEQTPESVGRRLDV